ncbi:MAG: hypothetical protein OQK69_06215 [Gammaproteobacteria bacterium]|nr:hypothetical protein [Gammaproteobacteria bacterium]
MFSTLRRTRTPSGSQLYNPEASRRIRPARNISWWLLISASAGVSFTVLIGNLDKYMEIVGSTCYRELAFYEGCRFEYSPYC